MGYAQFQNRTLEILEPGRSGDWPSKFCDYFIAALVVLNVLAVTLESVSDFSVNYARQFYIVESFSVVIFSAEYLMRVWASAANRAPMGGFLAAHAWGMFLVLAGWLIWFQSCRFTFRRYFRGLISGCFGPCACCASLNCRIITLRSKISSAPFMKSANRSLPRFIC